MGESIWCALSILETRRSDVLKRREITARGFLGEDVATGGQPEGVLLASQELGTVRKPSRETKRAY